MTRLTLLLNDLLELTYLGTVGPDSHPGYCDSRAPILSHHKFSSGSLAQPSDHDADATLLSHGRKKRRNEQRGKGGRLVEWKNLRLQGSSKKVQQS